MKVVIEDGRKLSELGIEIPLSMLENKTIAIDGNLMVYATFVAMGDSYLVDSEGNPTSHLKMIYEKVLEFNKEGISQIWVFDNPEKNPRKAATHKKRQERGNYLRPTREHYEEVQRMLSLMGVTYAIAPPGIEAEQYASWMTQSIRGNNPLCDFVYTSDTDVLFFGGNWLRTYKEGKTTKFAMFNYESVLQELEFDREEFLMIALILGHDFYEWKSRRIGFGKVYQRIKNREYDISDEEIAASLEQFNIDPTTYVRDHTSHIVINDYNKPELIASLVARGFREYLLLKGLENYREDIL